MADSFETVELYRKMLLSQFAAEAYLNGLSGELKEMVIDVENDYADPNTLTGRLVLGPNDSRYFAINQDGGQVQGGNDRWSATLMTKRMLQKFSEDWTVIDQLPNTSSGFSATLLRDKDGNYTLSFRSTESKSSLDGGDVDRDSSKGANGEIGKEGFAWAQIMDMEKYYSDLQQGKLGLGSVDPLVAEAFSNPETKISVTGYFLGSHLAQVFTRMHEDKVEHTYIFNGAGMGEFDAIEDQNLTDTQKRSEYGVTLINAISDLQQQYVAIVENPDAFYAAYNNALCQLRLGNTDKAIQLYTQTRKRNLEKKGEVFQGSISDLNDLIEKGVNGDEAKMILKDVFRQKGAVKKTS